MPPIDALHRTITFGDKQYGGEAGEAAAAVFNFNQRKLERERERERDKIKLLRIKIGQVVNCAMN